MVSLASSFTERLLLLLGWDRVESNRANIYKEKKAVAGSIRQRKRNSGSESTGEMFGDAPKLTPVRIVSQIARGPSASNAWTADAFDTAATGTV